jgi:hypothetical protein
LSVQTSAKQPPPSTPFRRPFAVIAVVMAAVAVVGTAMVEVTRHLASLDGVNPAPLVPAAWPGVAVDVVACIGGIVILARFSQRRWKEVLIMSACVVAISFSFARLAFGQEGIPVPSSLKGIPSAAATKQAIDALHTATCVIVRHDAAGLLPTPYQRCAESWPAPPQVEFFVGWGQSLATPAEYGFVYRPGAAPNESDACLEHLGGPWWAVMGLTNDLVPCASGFRFVGAP